jgi:hypothetical protein
VTGVTALPLDARQKLFLPFFFTAYMALSACLINASGVFPWSGKRALELAATLADVTKQASQALADYLKALS